MRLLDLFRDVEGSRVVGDSTVDVSSLSYRSTLAGPGHLFFCVPGLVRDGHEFAAEAVARGAAALCVERELPLPVTQVVVESVRWAMGPVAAAMFEHPSARMATVGITGTNGKTTTAYLTAFFLDEAGRRAGLLGTVERRIGGVVFPAERTTPEAVDLQQDLAMMVDAGDQAAVMEVSSHALDLGRAAGISFAAVAFTNLTQDHLDYHGTLEAYYGAKSRLFLDPRYARNRPPAVVNIDDAFGRLLAERITPDRLLTVAVGEDGAQAGSTGTKGEHTDQPPDLSTADLVTDADGMRGTLVLRGRGASAVARLAGRPQVKGEVLERPIQSRLIGRYNAQNVLTALGLGVALGLDLDAMLGVLPRFPEVPGRLERVDTPLPVTIAVDYAHTPDSVENVLRTARSVARGRVIALLGCGGDRDRGKRPKMGRAAETWADVLVVTSDNPRSEDPRAIIDEILGGLEHPEQAIVRVDRREAIGEALRAAQPGDMVLLLGKGHESGQQFKDHVVPFDDRDVARSLAAEIAEAGRHHPDGGRS